MDRAGLQFKIIYKDVHLLEVQISAWNGSFGGLADVYVGLEQLTEASKKLQRFPLNPSDVRELTLGGFGPESAGGGVSMRFYCGDRVGHTYVDSKIESAYGSNGKAQFVFMTLAVEPAAIDSFVEELGQLGVTQAGLARLDAVLKDVGSAARG